MSAKERALTTGGKLVTAAKTNSPKLFTAGVAAGVVVTGIFSAWATYKAMKEIEEEENDRWTEADIQARKEERILHKDYDKVFNSVYEPLTTRDKLRIGWKYYVPAVVMAASTITMDICLYKDTDNRIAKEAARAAAAELGHQIYRDEVRKQIGEKKEKDIQYAAHDKELEEKVMKNITPEMSRRCGAENGEQLFFDPKTGQYWVNTFETVRRACKLANKDLRFNEYYDLQLFLYNAGAGDADLSYRKAIPSAGQDHDAIEEETFLEVHLKPDYNGHEVSVVWLNYPVIDLEHY